MSVQTPGIFFFDFLLRKLVYVECRTATCLRWAPVVGARPLTALSDKRIDLVKSVVSGLKGNGTLVKPNLTV